MKKFCPVDGYITKLVIYVKKKNNALQNGLNSALIPGTLSVCPASPIVGAIVFYAFCGCMGYHEDQGER